MARKKSACALACEHCGNGSAVIDTRYHEGSMSVRRRRQCLKCGFRWNTYELRLTQGADSIDDVIFGSMTELQKLFEVLNTHYRGERKGGSPRTAD